MLLVVGSLNADIIVPVNRSVEPILFEKHLLFTQISFLCESYALQLCMFASSLATKPALFAVACRQRQTSCPKFFHVMQFTPS